MRSQYLISLLLVSLTVQDVLSTHEHRSKHEEPESMPNSIAPWRVHGSRLHRATKRKITASKERMRTLKGAVTKLINVMRLAPVKFEEIIRDIRIANAIGVIKRAGVNQALMLGYHPLQVMTLLKSSPDLAAEMSTVSLVHWKRNPKLTQLVEFIEEHDKWLSML
ncbi:RxLR-like protein [Plasmopara halstedii]|uniref:RxLR-like protein n=1 Tax=Plasmopara halstedii TaxID=4781 RepID=A0A0P1AB05_PLAHL|nr:RxLR-like protein [Plasmopara halstedii]CEG38070.1 RxLR-like protein [Plasmopara halstedii]|eukprot:XP_024574439.1 RxLR-like protein [Plasmopara halstedii]